MENILDRLKRGDILVGDGAMGTMLMQRGLRTGESPETYNLTKSHVLEEIAALYLEAGSEIVSTNTFGASPLRLRQYSLDKDVEAINRSAVEAVRRAVGNRAYVAGSVGPSGMMLKPHGDTTPEEVLASYSRQIDSLLAAGVDLLCVETIMDLREAAAAIEAARSLDPKIPVMATATFGRTPQGYSTLMGASVKDVVKALEGNGADVIGSNCGEGSAQMLEIAREFRQYARVPLAIQSNAGLPVKSETGMVYSETPDFVAAQSAAMLELGVQIIGGCCGTTPDHIRAIRKMVDARHKTA